MVSSQADEIIEQPVEELPQITVEPNIVEAPAVEMATEPAVGTIDDLEGETAANIELIKAKKVKLEGIKVVGKIDLPTKPKPKTTDIIADETATETSDQLTTEKKDAKTHHRPERRFSKKTTDKEKARRELSYSEKLQIEERNKQRELRKKAKEDKERKRKYYEQQLQKKLPQKPVKKKKETVAASTVPTSISQRPASKNPIKRLWAWLNGNTDRY